MRKIVPDNHQEAIQNMLSVLRKYIKPTGAIHIGAHQGEEVEAYLNAGFKKIILIEANPHWSEWLKNKYTGSPNILVLPYAVTNYNGQAILNINASRKGNTESSSLLSLKRLKEIYKYMKTETSVAVHCYRLDDIPELQNLHKEHYNFLNIDIQGAELLAFEGAPRWLSLFEAVLTEVNLLELYAGCPLEKDIESALENHGFNSVESLYHELYDEKSKFPAWGESLFIKKDLTQNHIDPTLKIIKN